MNEHTKMIMSIFNQMFLKQLSEQLDSLWDGKNLCMDYFWNTL
jgi:hypothetical protein